LLKAVVELDVEAKLFVLSRSLNFLIVFTSESIALNIIVVVNPEILSKTIIPVFGT